MPGAWASKIAERMATYEKRIRAARNSAAQDVARGMTTPVAKGGKMRVKTGFLRASLMASTTAMPKLDPKAVPDADAADGSYTLSFGPVNAVIMGATLLESIYLGFTAAYAGHREVWDGFIEGARLKWPETVKRNTDKARKAFP